MNANQFLRTQDSGLRAQVLNTANSHFPLSPQSSVLSPKRRTRRGFTFLEVLFSVIIIGVGMIMVAGMFPVAIEQTQANAADAAGVAVGRDALRYLQTVASTYVPMTLSGSTLSLLPPTTNAGGFYIFPNPPPPYPVMPLPNKLINIGPIPLQFSQSVLFPDATAAGSGILHNPAAMALGGNQAMTGDNRYGWIGFYRRDVVPLPTNGNYFVPAPYAQVWIITAQSTAEGQPPFVGASAVQPASSSASGLLSENIQSVTFANTSAYGSLVQIQKGATSAAPNAFVLCLNCPSNGLITGQVFRLGSVLGNDANGDTIWNLAPGYDLSSSNPVPAAVPYSLPADLSTTAGALPATAFILGSPWIPNQSAGTPGQYLGPVQDISVVTGYVRLSN